MPAPLESRPDQRPQRPSYWSSWTFLGSTDTVKRVGYFIQRVGQYQVHRSSVATDSRLSSHQLRSLGHTERQAHGRVYVLGWEASGPPLGGDSGCLNLDHLWHTESHRYVPCDHRDNYRRPSLLRRCGLGNGELHFLLGIHRRETSDLACSGRAPLDSFVRPVHECSGRHRLLWFDDPRASWDELPASAGAYARSLELHPLSSHRGSD